MKFTIFQNSRQGPRPYNQDRLAYSYSKDALLLVVADGMGGHRHGEVAAQLAVTAMTDAFQRLAMPTLTSPAKFLIDHIQQIHDMIDQLTQEREMIEAPRTTIVAAIVQRGMLYCAHVGDSRLYHFRGNHLLYRTEDHSVVQSLYNKGIINKDEMTTHPYRHKVYSCLGGDVPPKIDLADRQELAEGDTVLLCTDGVWGAVADDQIKQILGGASISDNVTRLLNQAELVSQEQGDNMSAIGLQWGDKLNSQLAVSTITMPMGSTTTIMNPITHPNPSSASGDHRKHELTDDEIEKTIAEIQNALRKTKRV
ncbi:MAG: protein phosphatase 2C domain-containing protein [Methylotenera sp.]|nr:protein phosphatase 2C domain-containing protein [Methylotenera sp.]